MVFVEDSKKISFPLRLYDCFRISGRITNDFSEADLFHSVSEIMQRYYKWLVYNFIFFKHRDIVTSFS